MGNILIQFNTAIIEKFRSFKISPDHIASIVLILVALDEEREDILNVLDDENMGRRMLILYRVMERYGMLERNKGGDVNYLLTKLGEELIRFIRNEFENYVGSPLTADVLNPISTMEELDWIQEYIDIFPSDEYCRTYRLNRKLRTHPKDVNTRMQWFIKVYNYTKDTILEATRAYIEQQEGSADGHCYTRGSNYFIVKGSGTDKVSDLASWCESVLHKDTSAENNPLTDII